MDKLSFLSYLDQCWQEVNLVQLVEYHLKLKVVQLGLLVLLMVMEKNLLLGKKVDLSLVVRTYELLQ